MSLLSETDADEVADGARGVLNALLDLPLATARDLTGLMGFSQSMVYAWLGHLKKQGLVDSVYLGWSAPISMHWFLTDQALSGLGRLGSNWHEEPARCRLLERFPSVEWFYLAAAGVRDMGAFEGFNWFDNVSVDAIARYERGLGRSVLERLLSVRGPDRLPSFPAGAGSPGDVGFPRISLAGSAALRRQRSLAA